LKGVRVGEATEGRGGGGFRKKPLQRASNRYPGRKKKVRSEKHIG